LRKLLESGSDTRTKDLEEEVRDLKEKLKVMEKKNFVLHKEIDKLKNKLSSERTGNKKKKRRASHATKLKEDERSIYDHEEEDEEEVDDEVPSNTREIATLTQDISDEEYNKYKKDLPEDRRNALKIQAKKMRELGIE
jgi:translation initiation factor 2B subunit (eIF-2B alpha/beta/delta family)